MARFARLKSTAVEPAPSAPPSDAEVMSSLHAGTLPHHRLAAGSEEVAATWRASAELRALVREVYADDYAAFGY